MGLLAAHIITIMPEIVLLLMISVILIVDVFLGPEKKVVSYVLAQVALFVVAIVVVLGASDKPQIIFDGCYIKDELSDVLKVFIVIVTGIGFLYTRSYLQQRDLFRGEYYVLSLCAVLGMMIMASAGNFISIYLGLELLALSQYALVSFDRESRYGSEAAMKFFILGAIASGILLYGVSMVYGATGKLDFISISKASDAISENGSLMVYGLVFLVIGIGFKLGAVPFHMWVPDVYQGAPTAVTLFIGTAPKLAGFAMAIRILVDGVGMYQIDWQGMLIIMSVLSIALGNLFAIAQTNIKRMLAYSTISHVGFIVMGLLAGTPQGYSAALFYTIIYAFMALGSFGILIILSRKGYEADSLDDFKGLHERNPWYAAMMLLFMFSLAGVPPMIGFFAKLVVLQAIIEVHLIWLALFGVFFSIIGAFYYLRIVKLMYFDKPDIIGVPVDIDNDVQLAMTINGMAMLALGMFPASLLSLCVSVFS